MTSRPPTEPLSRATRLIAAAVIAIAALGITVMADRWLERGPGHTRPMPVR